ncbi:MAG: His-Xaa-Ser system radical SAM maturase HxsC [Methylocystis sp.]
MSGFDREKQFDVIRLCQSYTQPLVDEDAALIRDPANVRQASANGFRKFVFLDANDIVFEENQFAYLALPDGYDYLNEGDVIGISASTGHFRSLFRRHSDHNSFFVTERCNHYCLMCSQPPRSVDDEWLLDEIRAALPLVDRGTKAFSFTGGEPLLSPQKFIGVLNQCHELLPQTSVHVLTNGRAFADASLARAWSEIRHPALSAGIPIYSAVDYIHDFVVQSKGAFDETVMGVLNLKNFGQRVEVRVVLHAVTAPRIYETCRWFSRNLPFVDHVALMGLENTGFALANETALDIDPLDYAMELEKGIECLITAGMSASIYNLPRCVLPRSLWPYAVQSISDWKRGFLAECEECAEKQNCSGFFTTGRMKSSRGISKILKTDSHSHEAEAVVNTSQSTAKASAVR